MLIIKKIFKKIILALVFVSLLINQTNFTSVETPGSENEILVPSTGTEPSTGTDSLTEKSNESHKINERLGLLLQEENKRLNEEIQDLKKNFFELEKKNKSYEIDLNQLRGEVNSEEYKNLQCIQNKNSKKIEYLQSALIGISGILFLQIIYDIIKNSEDKNNDDE